LINILGELFTSEKYGDDTSGDGTELKPFKTILQAMKHAGKEPFPVIYVDSKAEGDNVCDKYFFLHNNFNTLVNNYDMHIMIENNTLT